MKNIVLIFMCAILISGCAESGEDMDQKIDGDNPFLVESDLPYSAPDFSKIKNEHFRPAFLEGMRQQQENVKAIAESSEEPTFENTVLALEKSRELLTRVSQVFYSLTSAHTNEVLQEIESEMAPKLAAHNDEIYLNDQLFQRFKILFDQKEDLSLDAESLKLLEYYYENFELAGANLPEEEKIKLKEYNSRLASLTTKFQKTLLDGTNAGAVTFSERDDLEGVSESVLKSNENEDGGWTIPLLNTKQQPLLQSLANRDSREKLFLAGWHRTDHGEYDTQEIIKEIVKIRAEKSRLMGFADYAEWKLQRTMAKEPKAVAEFFKDLIPAATRKAQEESDEIQNLIYSQGEEFTLEPWDWNYYAEMVRKEKYDLDEDEIKPYFELTNVLEKGVFYAANQLFGITFEKRTDLPVYHEDVVVYELFEEDGEPLGLFYGDFYARPSKRGGAWMSNFVTQSKLYDKKPVIYNVCNYEKPSAGEPALLTFDNVITTFHEFGHALHGFFADQQYPSLSGTAVARDFVEFPSQINENWALHPDVLKNYAIHYVTGEQIPQELIDKIKNSATFNQGYSLTELFASADLDMHFHTIGEGEDVEDVGTFEKEALQKSKLDVVHAVPPRYRSTYFAHIFSSEGYAAGYYSYLWTEMLEKDAYDWFENNGGLTRENGQRFRDMILSRGNTIELEKMYRDWRGADPKIEPMLRSRGLD